MQSSMGQDTASDVHTTAQLARKLGLSRWSVSRAINGRSGISQETAQRVRQALREHQFEPDPLARGLRGGRTGMVGICLPVFSPSSMHDGYGDSTLRGLASMDRRLREFGYLPVLEPVCGQPEREQDAVRRFLAMRVQALLMVRPHSRADAPVFKTIRDKRLPGIAISPRETLPLTTANVDEKQAACLLARHLAALGHRKCILLGFDGGERNSQLVAALRQHGIASQAQADTTDENRVDGRSVYGVQRGRKVIGAAFTKTRPASAIIAANDALALGAIHALREKSYRVPEDCSVATYGNSELAESSLPALTSIDLQLDRLIERSTDFLCDQLRSPGRFETTELLINPVLVHRDSIVVPSTGIGLFVA